MRTRWQLLVATFVAGLALSQLLWAQGTRIEPGKLQIRSTAADALDVLGGGLFDNTIRIDQNGALIVMKSTGAAANAGLWYFQALNPGFRIGASNDDFSGQNDGLTFSRSGSAITSANFGVRISSITAQPAFLAYNSSADAGLSDNSSIDIDTEAYDQGGNFASDVFTAPVDGTYQLCAAVGITSASAVDSGVLITTTNGTYGLGYAESVNGFTVVGDCVPIFLAAGGTATLLLKTSGTVTVEGVVNQVRYTHFSGRLVP